MTTISESTLRKRAELVAAGYEQGENPTADVLHESVSREFEDGWVDLSPLTPGSRTPAGLRLRGYYPPTRDLYDVSDRLLDMNWNEATGQAAIQGSLELDNTSGTTSAYFNRPGITLLLETRQNSRVPFVERYRWVAWETDVSDLYEAKLTVDFYDFLYYIQTASCSVGYVADARHRGGWRAHEIAAAVLRQFHVPVGHLVATTYRIPSFILQGQSIYDVIAIAYSIDRHMTGNQYFIVSEKGRVAVIRSNGLLGLQGKRLNKKRTFVISDRDLNARPGASFKRSLDQYAAGIIPQGGDANLVTGNVKGHVGSYATSEGGRSDRASLAAQGRLNKQETAIAEQEFPEDVLTSTNPGATPNTGAPERPGTNAQHTNQLLASALLFGALKYQVSPEGIPNVNDSAYSKQAAQLLSDALSRTQKTITVPIRGNILLRVGMTVYVDLTFSAGRPLRKEIYISSLAHSLSASEGEYSQLVTLAWRESEVAVEQSFEAVTQAARTQAEQEASPGATNSGEGGAGAGTGNWVTVEASYYEGPGEGSFGGLQSPGYHYAELGTAFPGQSAPTGHGRLASALGLSGEVGAGFKIQIQANGKTVFATCEDRGEGGSNPKRAIDLYRPSKIMDPNALNLSTGPGTYTVKVRPAS